MKKPARHLAPCLTNFAKMFPGSIEYTITVVSVLNPVIIKGEGSQ